MREAGPQEPGLPGGTGHPKAAGVWCCFGAAWPVSASAGGAVGQIWD